MDIAVVEKLVNLLNGTTLSSLEIEEKDLKIKITNGVQCQNAVTPVVSVPVVPNESQPQTTEQEDFEVITAPIVGIFHPKDIKVGDKVSVGTTICIIEAMKLMNEIESDKDGEIAEILVKDGEAVEFGQPLFRIK